MKSHSDMKKISIIISTLFIAIILGSCDKPDENPDLVNPPLVSPTIGIRFLNLSGGEAGRNLRLNGDDLIEDVPFGLVSEQINPPADSTYIAVVRNGEKEFEMRRPVKYLVRNINYTFVSIETAAQSKDSTYKQTDSVVYFQTNSVPTRYDNQAYLRIFSGMNDSAKYSVRHGCPNGTSLLDPVGYGDIQLSPETVGSGELPISVIRQVGDKTSVIGTYNLVLDDRGDYCVLILPNYDKTEPEVFLYDEGSAEIEAVFPPDPIIEKIASVRVINMSEYPVSVTGGFGENIAPGLESLAVSDFSDVTACESQTSDELYFETEGTIDTVLTSFEVMQNYTFVSLDSADVPAGIKLRIPPSPEKPENFDSVRVRVINGISDQSSVTLSMGTRNTESGVLTGEYLARKIEFGKMTEEKAFAPGRAPLTLFTDTRPAKLLYSAYTEFEKGKDYLIIIRSDEDDNPELAVIESEETSKPVDFAAEGVFVQFASVASEIENISLELESEGLPVLNETTIPPSGVIATIVPEGQLTVKAAGKTHTVDCEIGKRLLLVAAGKADDITLFDINSSPMLTGSDFYTRRFVNATNDIETLVIRERNWPKDWNSGPPVFGIVDKYDVSWNSEVKLENKKTFYFFDGGDVKEESCVISDLIFSFGKAYTIILAGEYDPDSEEEKKDNGYYLTIIQEY